VTREQVMQLAGRIYDEMQGVGGGTGDGRAPKYDTALPAGSGLVVYASECSAKELQYQITRASKPPSDPKYAESNAKRVKSLGYWLSYRQASPSECWTGERNRRTVTAAAPSDRPEKYPRDAQTGSAPAATPDTFSGDESDIPF
jgi:hypothetical protein